MADLLTHPAFAWALVVGVFGGVGLVLIAMFSRRGPLVFPAHAALFASLAVLLARDPEMPFRVRLASAFAGFAVAVMMQYIAVGIAADRERRRRGFTDRLPLAGHVWRLSLVLTLGLVACIGVAFATS